MTVVTDPRDELEGLLRRALEQHDSLAVYFRLAEQSGLSLVDALDAIDWDEEWPEGDPVLALIEHCGSPERAQRVLDASAHHRAIDAALRLRNHRARLAAQDAIASDAPLDDVVALLRTLPLSDRDRELHWMRLVSPRSLVELAHLVPETMAEQRGMAWALRARHDTPLAALEALRDAGTAEEATIELLQRHWGAPSSPESDPALALLDVHAQLLEAASRPVRLALASLPRDTELTRWLPVLRRRGLGATAAALFMHERVPPIEAAAIARLLHDAGYDDDQVLRALLENGLSSARALRLLGEHGWSVDRMVGSLVARAQLLPEVRDHLLALGLSRPAIIDVLLRHAPQELVDLTVWDEDR